MLVRGYSIKYGARKAKARNLTLQVLEKKLYQLEQRNSSSIELFSDEKNSAQNFID